MKYRYHYSGVVTHGDARIDFAGIITMNFQVKCVESYHAMCKGIADNSKWSTETMVVKSFALIDTINEQ